MPAVRVYDGWRFATSPRAPRRCGGSRRTARCRRCCACPTRRRRRSTSPTRTCPGRRPGGCLAVTRLRRTPDDVAAPPGRLRRGTRRRRRRPARPRSGRGVANRPVPGTVPARSAARRGRVRRDARDGDVLVRPPRSCAAPWQHRPDRVAAAGKPAVVLCHISHVYETGASLYFTVLCAQTDDPIAQWAAAKTAANAAIRAAGATISHHHGVGTDHRAAYQDEIGPLALEMLRAAKASSTRPASSTPAYWWAECGPSPRSSTRSPAAAAPPSAGRRSRRGPPRPGADVRVELTRSRAHAVAARHRRGTAAPDRRRRRRRRPGARRRRGSVVHAAAVMAIVPAGRGNDLARALDCPTDDAGSPTADARRTGRATSSSSPATSSRQRVLRDRLGRERDHQPPPRLPASCLPAGAAVGDHVLARAAVTPYRRRRKPAPCARTWSWSRTPAPTGTGCGSCRPRASTTACWTC